MQLQATSQNLCNATGWRETELSAVFSNHREVRNELLQKHRQSVRCRDKYKEALAKLNYHPTFESLVEGGGEYKFDGKNSRIWRRAASMKRIRGYVDEDFVIRPLLTLEEEVTDTDHSYAICEARFVSLDGESFYDALENATDEHNVTRTTVQLDTSDRHMDTQLSEQYYDCFQRLIEFSSKDQEPCHNGPLGESDSDLRKEKNAVYEGFMETITPIPESPCVTIKEERHKLISPAKVISSPRHSNATTRQPGPDISFSFDESIWTESMEETNPSLAYTFSLDSMVTASEKPKDDPEETGASPAEEPLQADEASEVLCKGLYSGATSVLEHNEEGLPSSPSIDYPHKQVAKGLESKSRTNERLSESPAESSLLAPKPTTPNEQDEQTLKTVHDSLFGATSGHAGSSEVGSLSEVCFSETGDSATSPINAPPIALQAQNVGEEGIQTILHTDPYKSIKRSVKDDVLATAGIISNDDCRIPVLENLAEKEAGQHSATTISRTPPAPAMNTASDSDFDQAKTQRAVEEVVDNPSANLFQTPRDSEYFPGDECSPDREDRMFGSAEVMDPQTSSSENLVPSHTNGTSSPDSTAQEDSSPTRHHNQVIDDVLHNPSCEYGDTFGSSMLPISSQFHDIPLASKVAQSTADMCSRLLDYSTPPKTVGGVHSEASGVEPRVHEIEAVGLTGEDTGAPLSPPRPKRESGDILATKWSECVGMSKKTIVDQGVDRGFLASGASPIPASPGSERHEKSPLSSISASPDSRGEIRLLELSAFEGDAPGLYIDTLYNLKPSPKRPLDWNTHHLIARASPRHPRVYSGPNQIESTRTPKSVRTSQSSNGRSIGSFNAPVLRTSERARLRKPHDQPSTPHRVESCRRSFSPTSHSTRGTSVRSRIASPPRPQSLMSPQIVKSSSVAPRTAPQLRSKQETPPRGPKSINRPTQRRKVREDAIMCTSKFVHNLHPTMGPCDRCWSLASPEEQARFKARGSHLCIVRTRGGCDRNCKVFPPLPDEPTVRLCRKCFFATHVHDGDRLQVYRGNHVKITPKC